jgi:hypothetical protein
MRPRRATLALLACAAAAAVPWQTDAGASTSIAIPFDELVRQSSAAAVVTPMTQMALWEDGRIVTYTDASVDTPVAGAALGSDVWVRTLGGEVGHLGQAVEGEAALMVGRPTLLFLLPAMALHAGDPAAEPEPMPGVYAVTARAQGQFPVVTSEDGQLHVVRSSAMGALVLPKGVAVPRLASDALHGLKVADATDSVAGAWGRLHAQ